MATEDSEVAPFPLCDVPDVRRERGNYVETFYWEMAVSHNTYLRGMNSIWTNAPKVIPSDELSFVGYCRVVGPSRCSTMLDEFIVY